MPDRSESGLKFLPLLIGKCMFRRGRDAKTRPGSAGCWCQGYRKSGRVEGKCDDLMAIVVEVVTVVDLMPSLGLPGLQHGHGEHKLNLTYKHKYK